MAGLSEGRQRQLLPLRQATVEPSGRPEPEVPVPQRVRRRHEQVRVVLSDFVLFRRNRAMSCD